jgi:hypothetical protein
MSRILWLVAAGFVCAIAAGCGGSGAVVEQPTKTFQAPKEKGKPMSMGGQPGK